MCSLVVSQQLGDCLGFEPCYPQQVLFLCYMMQRRKIKSKRVHACSRHNKILSKPILKTHSGWLQTADFPQRIAAFLHRQKISNLCINPGLLWKMLQSTLRILNKALVDLFIALKLAKISCPFIFWRQLDQSKQLAHLLSYIVFGQLIPISQTILYIYLITHMAIFCKIRISNVLLKQTVVVSKNFQFERH